MQEVRLSLPLSLPPAVAVAGGGSGRSGGGGNGRCEEIHLACSGAMVVRNSRALALARGAALARALVFEEDAPALPAADAAPADACGGAAGLLQRGHGGATQAVRATAAAVVGTLPELWPGAQVWEGRLLVVSHANAAGAAVRSGWWRRPPQGRPVGFELLCGTGARDAALQCLQGVLTEGAAQHSWGEMVRVCG
jgi:hypothetical protein